MLRVVRLASVNDFAEWRAAARALLLQGIDPENVAWADPAIPRDLLSDGEASDLAPVVSRGVGRVPPRFLRLAQAVICHHDPSRFALLYRFLWRLQKDRRVLSDLDDTDVAKINRRAEAVLAEMKRARDGLRFRRAVSADGHKGLAATLTPAHYILEGIAPHFTTAVANEDWVIETPYRCAFWDRKALTFGPARTPRR